jgi:hypothetical protein
VAQCILAAGSAPRASLSLAILVQIPYHAGVPTIPTLTRLKKTLLLSTSYTVTYTQRRPRGNLTTSDVLIELRISAGRTEIKLFGMALRICRVKN